MTPGHAKNTKHAQIEKTFISEPAASLWRQQSHVAARFFAEDVCKLVRRQMKNRNICGALSNRLFTR
jgi:hypothetical protein